MAISGTYAAGDYESQKGQVIGLDINASGTYVDISTWAVAFRISRNERTTAELKSHGGITQTVTGTLPNVDIEIDVFYDTVSTGPYMNMVSLLEGSDQDCNVKISPNSLTTPTTGDVVYELTSGVITNVSEPEFDENAEAEVPIVTLSFNGVLGTTNAA